MVVWKLNCTRLNLNFVSGMPRADLYSWVVQKSEGMLVHYDPQDTSHAASSLHQPSVTQQRSAPASFNTLGTRGASDWLWRVKGDQFSCVLTSHYITPLQQPPPDQKNCPLKLSTSQPSIGVEKQFPCKNQIQKSGRFRDRHFCLYFELGCELAQGEAQAQNTSKNDDLENGPNFVFDFFVESTYLAPNKAGMCLVLLDNFSEQPVEVRVLWLSLFMDEIISKHWSHHHHILILSHTSPHSSKLMSLLSP